MYQVIESKLKSLFGNKNRLDTKKCGIRKSKVLFIIHIYSTFNKILQKKCVDNLINTINNKFSRNSKAIPFHLAKNANRFEKANMMTNRNHI